MLSALLLTVKVGDKRKSSPVFRMIFVTPNSRRVFTAIDDFFLQKDSDLGRVVLGFLSL